MSLPTLIIETPEGEEAALPIPAHDQSRPLTEVLAEHGFGLNTRCGGRGLCKGCQVKCDGGQIIRGCETTFDTLPTGTVCLNIPSRSWPNRSLFGVSCFEIRAKLPKGPSPRSGIALALDIGTTTLAGALWDLSSGQCLADLSLANPQRRYGDNVLSRISYALAAPTHLHKLQATLIDKGLKPLIQMLCRQAHLTPDAIGEACAAGNPAMLHTLLGAPLDGLGTYPFKPVFLEQQQRPAAEIGLDLDCTLTLLPSLGPFVGADITAGALAANLLADDPPILLIDFGTNGEILLKHRGGYLATATAAGPAFEGGRLACGASAGDGIMSSIAHDGNAWTYKLCSDAEAAVPKGISGAAYVDFMAIGLERGVLNLFGRFDRSHPEVSEYNVDGDTEWIVRLSEQIYISEADVAELLQAKAAIGAGVQVLLEQVGLCADDLRTVFVAGGFGYHLDPAHARRIGLLPPVDLKIIETIGNASLGGASLWLQADFSKELATLCNHSEIVELNLVSNFADHYTDALLLEAMDD